MKISGEGIMYISRLDENSLTNHVPKLSMVASGMRSGESVGVSTSR